MCYEEEGKGVRGSETPDEKKNKRSNLLCL